MAVEISKIFAPPEKTTEPPKPAKEITTDEFFKMVGAKVKHGHPPG